MTTPKIEPRKVLIADDDEDSRAILSLILGEEGWDVEEARDGKEALEKVMQCQPDVLVLDNRMPELTGAEVYQRLKAEGINLGVVLATAYADLAELASSLKITHFVSKPFDIPELLASVESAYEEFHQKSMFPEN